MVLLVKHRSDKIERRMRALCVFLFITPKKEKKNPKEIKKV